jgi:AbrB family looped-hinge helix DNA binding protein
MSTVKVSGQYQVVIPKDVRDRLGLEVGATMEIMACGGRLELIPIRPMRSLKGFLKGINTSVDRESDRV